MYNSAYFFSKYITINQLVAKKGATFSSFNANSSSPSFDYKNKIYYVFQYNVLNSIFIASIRQKFFKYDVNITSSKKGVMKFLFPNFSKKYFFNSSFVVSFPVSDLKHATLTYSLLNDHISKAVSSSRFSSFPIAIFFNNENFPIEYANFLISNTTKLEIFFSNIRFSSFIIMTSYFRQIFILNNFFFRKNGNC